MPSRNSTCALHVVLGRSFEFERQSDCVGPNQHRILARVPQTHSMSLPCALFAIGQSQQVLAGSTDLDQIIHCKCVHWMTKQPVPRNIFFNTESMNSTGSRDLGRAR